MKKGIYKLNTPCYIEWNVFGKKGNGIASRFEIDDEENGYLLKDGSFICTDYITKISEMD